MPGQPESKVKCIMRSRRHQFLSQNMRICLGEMNSQSSGSDSLYHSVPARTAVELWIRCYWEQAMLALPWFPVTYVNFSKVYQSLWYLFLWGKMWSQWRGFCWMPREFFFLQRPFLPLSPVKLAKMRTENGIPTSVWHWGVMPKNSTLWGASCRGPCRRDLPEACIFGSLDWLC